MTKRQRAKLNENYQPDLLQLPMGEDDFRIIASILPFPFIYEKLTILILQAESTRKKHLTEEEIALRKSEIARRRKHQSIQRAEQDKVGCIIL